MKPDARKYWVSGHRKYSELSWIDKPSIFATRVIKHFPKNGILLDLGAGQGQDSRYFAGKGYKVWCTDFSNFALKIAQEKAKKAKLNIMFLNVDISKQLPFRTGEFNIVYSHLALHYWNKQETRKIFDEIYRVLKPNGIVAALFNSQTDPEIKEFKKVGENLYYDPKGLVKSYFTADYLKKFIEGKFKIVLLDDQGESYKDRIKTLVRFVGKKKENTIPKDKGFGCLKGKIWISDDFDKEDPEINKMFYGEGDP